MRAFALLRLYRRPATALHAVALLPFLVAPLLVALGDSSGDAAVAIARGAPSVDTERLAFLAGIALPLLAGASLSITASDLSRLPQVLALGRARRGLALDMLATAAVVSLIAGALAARAAATIPAGMAFAVAASLALLWFAVVGAVADFAWPRVLRYALLAAVVAAYLRPEVYRSLVAEQPVATALASLAAAGTLLWHQLSRPSHLARVRDLDDPDEDATTARARPARPWDASLVRADLLRWVRAASFESHGWRRLGWTGFVVACACWTAAFMHLAGLHPAIGMAGALGYSGLRLDPGLSHPLPRRRRARIAWTGDVVHVGAICLLTGLCFAALTVLDLPTFPWRQPVTVHQSWAELLVVLAAAPLAQWWYRRRATVGTRVLRVYFTSLSLFLVVAVLLVPPTLALRDFAPRAMLPALALLAIASQLAYASLLHRHYTRADLAPTR